MHVFPGGALDDTDPSLQYCALRETYEETGILIPPGNELEPSIPTTKYSSYNEAILKETGVEYRSVDWENLGVLKKFTQWTTPKFEKRRFTTQFFVYRTPYQFDFSSFARTAEVMSLEWMTPAEARTAFYEKRIKFMPPQFFLTTMIGRLGMEETARVHGHRAVSPKLVNMHEDGRVELDLGTGHSALLRYDPNRVIEHIELKDTPIESKI